MVYVLVLSWLFMKCFVVYKICVGDFFGCVCCKDDFNGVLGGILCKCCININVFLIEFVNL